ncbi:hypothetical protein [Candidatus Paracaedibacter symbiosus]|uniref:hypothetical protein n=1 Tax=Candidatus Paracaedibacter symbiosus TaxID=244582 RepID=UPI0004F6984B|nr:hypothetical protein [Candidatus Paracaedibacter symbiosus]AIL13447.1 hypothetical protein IM40_08040 [Candidatus Paracaedimonas acanthamoebae]AIL13508.1 hypothetical protein IM40_08465 [Candidatus Paracaedimonas acanthamoebae]
MTERPKLTIKKSLSLNQQSQLFQALKPLHEQTKKEKHQDLQQQKQKEREAKQKKKEETKVALRWLYEQFPACFNPKDLKPLNLILIKIFFLFLKKRTTLQRLN